VGKSPINGTKNAGRRCGPIKKNEKKDGIKKGYTLSSVMEQRTVIVRGIHPNREKKWTKAWRTTETDHKT